MRCCCLIADGFASTYIEPDQIKGVGSTWGSWKTWRSWKTDNVLCHDFSQSQQLLQRAFQAVCNFYTQRKHYAALNRPLGVNLYDGDFQAEIDHPEEIVAMHLVADQNDLVLLFGYDLTVKDSEDRFENHKRTNYVNAFRATLNTYPNTQWVLIDHPGAIDPSLGSITNITCDKFETVLQLLN
jgi:hypothetical protein